MLVLKVIDEVQQGLLVETQPVVFHKMPPHIEEFETILVRLSRIVEAEVGARLQQGWAAPAPRLLGERAAR